MANKNIEDSIDQVDGIEPTEDEATAAPKQIFKKYADAAIRVSRGAGTVWKSRKDQAIHSLRNDGTLDSWDEAIAYYRNDQSGKTTADPDHEALGALSTGKLQSTENIVFSNVASLVPSLYAKNPSVTVTTTHKSDEAMRQKAIIDERLINTLLQKRTAPGVNLKPKARRAVVMSTLTNAAYIETGYILKEESSDGVMQQLIEINAKLEKAKPEEVRELEGQLLALEEKVDVLSPSGPFTKFRHPKDVLIDPDATLGDLSDAQWIMIRDVKSTDYIKAVYMDKDEDGEMKNIYKPSHVLKADSGKRDISGHDEEINQFSLLDLKDEQDYKQYGYDSEDAYRKGQRTVCWYVWDKNTRRVFLYADHDWSWPIWVWDDPYGFEEFFPIDPLSFHTDPERQYARGEVAYYLDQQDEINKINDHTARLRDRSINKTIINKRAIGNDAERIIEAYMAPNDKRKALVLDFDPQLDISKAIMAFPIPKELGPLLDKTQLYQAIDRVSSVSALLKGVEFKTNTTNKAIESYESSTQTRLDEKIDAIEELIGRVGSKILTLCIQFMSAEDVVEAIGPLGDVNWQNMSARDAARSFEMTVIGGSSLKPTSKVRKEQAMQMAQILGQFASKVPAAFVVALKVMERAFGNEIDITAEDWTYIRQTIEQEMQRGAGGQGGQPSEGGEVDPQAILQQISDGLEQAPDEVKAQIGQQIAQGVPLVEIVNQLAQDNGQGA